MYNPTNREKKLTPRLRSSWCRTCTAFGVRDGKKCLVCGTRKLPRRFKK